MASVKTQYLRDKLLNWMKGTAFGTAPTTVYLALFTSAPNDAGSITGEVSATGTGYTRQAITFGSVTVTAGSYDSISNSAAITFPATGSATANWGTIVDVGILDSATVGAGNLLYFGLLSASQVVNTGNVVTFPIGALVIQEN